MKKKILLAIMTFVCVMACVFGLAACNNGDKNSSQGGGTSGSGNAPVQEIGLNKDTDFVSLVSDKLTESQWRAVFTDENFANVTLEQLSEGQERAVMLRESTDSRLACLVKENNATLYENGTLTRYMYSEGTWYFQSREMTREQVEANAMGYFFTFELVACDVSDFYSQFTYDDAEGAYIYSGSGIDVNTKPFEWWATTFKYVKIKFKNGRLASFNWKDELNDFTYNYYDYGKTTAEIPQNAQPYENI